MLNRKFSKKKKKKLAHRRGCLLLHVSDPVWTEDGLAGLPEPTPSDRIRPRYNLLIRIPFPSCLQYSFLFYLAFRISIIRLNMADILLVFGARRAWPARHGGRTNGEWRA